VVAVVNFQVSVLKILAGYPTRLATLRELKRDLSLLATSGEDWSDLTNRLAAAFPKLDIFTLGLVERYSFGWLLTQKGLVVLEIMENETKAGLTSAAGVEKQAEPSAAETMPAEQSFAEKASAEPPALSDGRGCKLSACHNTLIAFPSCLAGRAAIKVCCSLRRKILTQSPCALRYRAQRHISAARPAVGMQHPTGNWFAVPMPAT
jgi:hypothetical protein